MGLGYSAKNLLLPGHGTSARDFAEHGWDHRVQPRPRRSRARDRPWRTRRPDRPFDGRLRRACRRRRQPRVAGVAALCPLLRLSTNALHLVRVVKSFRTLMYQLGTGGRPRPPWRDADAMYATGYQLERRPPAVVSLLQLPCPDLHAALPTVPACPTLVVRAPQRSHVVPLRDGTRNLQSASAFRQEKSRSMRSDTSIMPSPKSVERQLVFERVSRFCDQCPRPSPRCECRRTIRRQAKYGGSPADGQREIHVPHVAPTLRPCAHLALDADSPAARVTPSVSPPAMRDS